MSFLNDALRSRGRAVPILGLNQILGWGSIFYAPALLASAIAAEFGWSLTFTVSGITIGLVVAALCSPISTRLVHRLGGYIAIAAGALIMAVGLSAITFVADQIAYIAVWVWLGIGMSLVLSDPSYVALAQIFPGRARKPMVLISMFAGLAGSVSWLSTYLLMESGSWRTPFLIYAAFFGLVSAPLVAPALPRPEKTAAETTNSAPGGLNARWPPRGLPLWLQFGGFATYAITISATLAHFIPITQRSGIDPGTAVGIAMLLGPLQLAARLFELLFGQRVHPLLITRIATAAFLIAFILALTVGFSIPVAVAFVLLMGLANGIMTIARGVLPLAMFGQDGYPKAAGTLAFGSLASQAAGPLAVAAIIEHGSDFLALVTLAGFAAASLTCFLILRRPSRATS